MLGPIGMAHVLVDVFDWMSRLQLERANRKTEWYNKLT